MVETEGLTHRPDSWGRIFTSRSSRNATRPHRQPDDIAKVATFLASPDSGWITGETLLVAAATSKTMPAFKQPSIETRL